MKPASGQTKTRFENLRSDYVLIVDDNHDVFDAFKTLLEVWGYAVKVADSGYRALELAQDAYPAVAFIDLNMPGMNGYELAFRLRRLKPRDAKLFAVSASIRERPDNCLFDGLFPKPMNLEIIADLMKALSIGKNRHGNGGAHESALSRYDFHSR